MKNSSRRKAIFSCFVSLIGVIILISLVLWGLFQIKWFESAIISIAASIIFAILTLGYSIVIKLYNLLTRQYIYDQRFKNKKIRLSFAYLVRVKVNNKYLLIKNSNRDIYQPIGGVYHIEDMEYVKNKFGYVRDETPGDYNDIRGTVLGYKVSKFIKWFNKEEGREIGPEREFIEETAGKAPFIKEAFLKDKLNFKYSNTYYRGIQECDIYDVLELLRFDVFDLVLTEEQLNILLEYNFNNDENFKLATPSNILKLGITETNDKRLYGTQTKYILEELKYEEDR